MSDTDSTVSARVPRELRNQGDAALKRINSTVSELVNSAFEYVIKTGQLPTEQKQPNPEEKTVRRFDSAEQKEQFLKQLKASSLPISPEYASLTAQEIKAMRLAERYGESS